MGCSPDRAQQPTGARTAGLAAMLAPDAVAVIGASRRPGRIGHRVLQNLAVGNYHGRTYGINPSGGTGPEGVSYHRSVRDLPEIPDLGIVCVPGNSVLTAAQECAALGVPGILVMADMAEGDGAGAGRASDLRALSREFGMRIIGPNTNGLFVSRGRDGNLLATFATSPFGPFATLSHSWARVAILGQGGGLTSYVGFEASGFVPEYLIDTGNELDVDLADCLWYLQSQPEIGAVGLIAESSRHGRRLSQAVRDCTGAGVRVTVLMLGRTAAGIGAASLHTGALASGNATLRQELEAAGAFVTGDERDFSAAVSNPPPPREPHPAKPRVGIVTWSGGVGVHLADLMSERGIPLATFSAPPTETEANALRSDIVLNPLDLGGFSPRGTGGPTALERLGIALGYVLRQPDVDACAIFESTVFQRPDEYRQHLVHLTDASARYGKPIFFCGSYDAAAEVELRAAGVRPYRFHSDLAAGILALAPAGQAPQRQAARPAEKTERQTQLSLVGSDAAAILAPAGVPAVRSLVLGPQFSVAEAAAELGYPIVLKLVHPHLLHKSEHGAVRLAYTPSEVASGVNDLRAIGDQLGLKQADIVAEEYARGLEMAVGAHVDADLGPTVMVGRGGVEIEIWRDTASALAPVDAARARQMLTMLSCFPLLEGARSSSPYDIDALVNLVVGVSEFIVKHQEKYVGIDLNPVMVRPAGEGLVAADMVIIGSGP
jgi:acetate---CoA ligase (ADP-forming)